MKGITRRRFLQSSSLAVLGLWGAGNLPSDIGIKSPQQTDGKKAGYGPLVPDPERILNLPEGFSYKLISRWQDTMWDGFVVPGNADGMAAFPGPDGLTVVLRNHEVWPGYPPSRGAFGPTNERLGRVNRSRIYDWGRNGMACYGGVSTLVYDTRNQEVKDQFLSLAGTLANCSGGATPWGTWISCEEEFQDAGFVYARDHGYAFEVEVKTKHGLQRPRPLKALGRFIHEGVAVLPGKDVIYQTEDQSDSLFYRFLPDKPNDLSKGKLQCLALAGKSGFDTRNWREQKILEGEKAAVKWIDLEDVEPKKNDLRHRGYQKGGAIFANGEGIAAGDGVVYFDCTYGGPNKAGQVWRYWPSPSEGTAREKEEPGQLELFLEPNNKRVLYNPDQMAVAPWGDLFICEDNPERQFLWGITPQGRFYLFAMNVKDDSELAGVCFSPDRTTMFLNMQNIGLTFAITGPWETE
jgi:secreted PhoX family phosphatase